ncbi:hypothetical protein Dimus_005945 [Dionaea muscipula]
MVKSKVRVVWCRWVTIPSQAVRRDPQVYEEELQGDVVSEGMDSYLSIVLSTHAEDEVNPLSVDNNTSVSCRSLSNIDEKHLELSDCYTITETGFDIGIETNYAFVEKAGLLRVFLCRKL